MKVVVTGGELFNKGAQSMTFTVVNEVKRRYPDAQITLLSTPDFVRSDEEKQNYKFEILPWDLRFKLRRFPVFGLFIKAKYFSAQQEQLAWQRFCESDLLLDISGFGLASVFSKQRIANYLLDIALAKRQKLPMVLMPQSFGPFAFQGALGKLFSVMTRKLIRYPRQIYARELAGMKELQNLATLDTVSKSVDLVLQSPEVDAANIFNTAPSFSNDFGEQAVAIVPNQKVKLHGGENSVETLYCDLIAQLRDKDKTVYLLRHSYEDKAFVDALKQQFQDDTKVIALTDDMNALQLEHIIGQMQYIIASRYHAVVHAYRQNVPCLVLGWAVKYQELTALLGQKQYCVDLTESVASGTLIEKLAALDSAFPQEREHIQSEMEKVRQDHHVFDDVFKG